MYVNLRPPILQTKSGRSGQVDVHRRPLFLCQVSEIWQWWPDMASEGYMAAIRQNIIGYNIVR